MAENDYAGPVQIVGKQGVKTKKRKLDWDDEKVAGRPEMTHVMWEGMPSDHNLKFFVGKGHVIELIATMLKDQESISFSRCLDPPGSEVPVMLFGEALTLHSKLNPIYLPEGAYRAYVSDPEMIGRVELLKKFMQDFDYYGWIGAVAAARSA